MKRPDPPSDKDIAEAFLALDKTLPDGHLDDFSSRVLARLDEPEASAMDARELARGSGLSRPNDAEPAVVNAKPITSDGTPEPAPDEHSGLHEIKALASTTRRRISQRNTSQAEADESLLVGASSGSFRTAALPDPARQETGDGDRAVARARERLGDAAGPASAVDARPAPSRSSSLPFWLLGGVAATAAAAAVAVFVFGIGRADQREPAAGDRTVAVAETPAAETGAALETGTASPAPEMKFAEPPPAAGAAAPASAPVIGLLEEGEKSVADEGKADDQPADPAAAKGKQAGAAGRADRSEGREKRREPEARKNEDSKTKPPAGGDGGGKDLDDVLDEVTGGVKTPAKEAEQAPARPSKKGLDRRDVAVAMGAVRGAAMRCRDREQFEGTITVKFQVAPSGRVTSAEATGGKKGTPTGDCVAAAVKAARFPAFDGATTSFTYPFLLAE